MHITTLRRNHSCLIFADAGTIWHLSSGQIKCELPGQFFEGIELQQHLTMYEGASLPQAVRGLVKLTAIRDSEILQQEPPASRGLRQSGLFQQVRRYLLNYLLKSLKPAL